MDVEITTKNFELYQDRLIEQYYTSEKDKWIAEKVFQKASDLFVGKISSLMFKNEIEKIYKDAEEIHNNILT